MQSVHSETFSSSSFQDAIDFMDESKPSCHEQPRIIAQESDVTNCTDEKLAGNACEVELKNLNVGEDTMEVHSVQEAMIPAVQLSHEQLVAVEEGSITYQVNGNLGNSFRAQEQSSCVLGLLSINDNVKFNDEQMNCVVASDAYFLLSSATDDEDVKGDEENRKTPSIDLSEQAETLLSKCAETECLELSGQPATRWFSFGSIGRAMLVAKTVSTSYLGGTGSMKLENSNANTESVESTEGSALQLIRPETFPKDFGQDGEDAKSLNFEDDASFIDDACFGDVVNKEPLVKADCVLESTNRNAGNLDSFEWVDGFGGSEADNAGVEGEGKNSFTEVCSNLTSVDQVSSDATWQWWPWWTSTNVSRASGILVCPVEKDDHTHLLSKGSFNSMEQGSLVSDYPAFGTEEIYSFNIGTSPVMEPILVSYVNERNLEVSYMGAGGGLVCSTEKLSGEEYQSSDHIFSSTIANVSIFEEPEVVAIACCEFLSSLNQLSTLRDTESETERPYKLENSETITPLPHTNNGLCKYENTTVVPQEDSLISSSLNIVCTEVAEIEVRTGGCSTPSVEEGELKKETVVGQDEIGSGIGVSPLIESDGTEEQTEELYKSTKLSDETEEQTEELYKSTKMSDETEEPTEELNKGSKMSDETEEPTIEELYKGTKVNLDSDNHCQSTIPQQHYSQGLEDEYQALDHAVSGNAQQLDIKIPREWNLLEDKMVTVSLLPQTVESNVLSYDQCVSDGSNQFVLDSKVTVGSFEAIVAVEPGVGIEHGLNVVVTPVKLVGEGNFHNSVEESLRTDDLTKLSEHGQSEIGNNTEVRCGVVSIAIDEGELNAIGLESKLDEQYSVELQQPSIMETDGFLSSESVNGSKSNTVYNMEVGTPTCETLVELNCRHAVNKAYEGKTVDEITQVAGMLCQMTLGDSLKVNSIMHANGWDLLDEIRSLKEDVEKENLTACKVQEESHLQLNRELSQGLDHASRCDRLIESGTLEIITTEVCPRLGYNKALSSNLDDIDDVFNEPSAEEYGHLIGKEAFTPILCNCQGPHILQGDEGFILKHSLGSLGSQYSSTFTGPAFDVSIPDLRMEISPTSMTTCMLGEAPSWTADRSWLYFLHLSSSSFLHAHFLAFLPSNYRREIAPGALHWLTSPQQKDSHGSEPLEVFDRGSLVGDKWLNKTVVMSAIIGATAGGVVGGPTVPLILSVAGLEIGSYTAVAVGALAGAGLASSLATALKHTSFKKTSDARRLQVPGTDTDESDHFDEGDSFFMVEKEDLEEAVLHRFFDPPVPLSSLPEWAPPANFGYIPLS